MECKWILTNIHEQKSYVITNVTLLGTKDYCKIKVWGIGLTENDIRFEVRGSKYICVKLLRTDIKTFNIKLNQRPVTGIRIHLHHNNYISIESYLFRITKAIVSRASTEETLLATTTKTSLQRYQNRPMKRKERPIAKVTCNVPALTGKCKDGKMIDTRIPQEDPLWFDLTEDNSLGSFH